MQLLKVKATTWLAMLFLCLLLYISVSCGTSNNTGSSSSPNTTLQPSITATPEVQKSSIPANTKTSTFSNAQRDATIAPGSNNPYPTPTTVVATPTKAINTSPTMTAVAVSQTMTAVATNIQISYPTPVATSLPPTPSSPTMTAVAVSQTMTAVATNIQISYPTVTATPTPMTPQLTVDKTSLNASSDCTTSPNADGNGHPGWVCSLTLTNSGTTDINWTSNSSASNAEIFVQGTQTNQGTVSAGQQQQVDFIVLDDTSTCSGSYTLTFSTFDNAISVSWNC